MSFGARAVIRSEALRHNLGVLRNAVPGCRVMAVVKANAYGHGLGTVAGALDEADSFAVARLDEARQLREAGITRPIVLLEGVWDANDQVAAINQGCELVVHNNEQVELLAAHSGGRAIVWLKVDTGMHRLGFPPDACGAVVDRLRALPAVRDVRLMTHFSSADELDNQKTQVQLDAFATVAKNFDGDVSIANSPASIGWGEVASLRESLGFTGDHWIRPGIALYGVSPFGDRTGNELGLRAVMRFEARLIATKNVRAGEFVGYKERFRVERDTVIGVISAGYGDGYPRQCRDGAPVLLNGRRVPLAGIVSMDMLTVDLGADAQDRVGDVATLWGEELPVEEVADWAGTIPYTLVCGVTHRESA